MPKASAAAGIEQAQVMTGVAGRVEAYQDSTAEIEGVAVGGGEDAVGGHGQQRTVQAVGLSLAIHSLDGGEQRGRVGHVSRPARMYDQPRLGKGLHHRPSPAGVIEMDVGQEYVIDAGRRQSQPLQGVQHTRQAGGAGGIHHGDPAARDEEINRGQSGPEVASVQGINAGFVAQ